MLEFMPIDVPNSWLDGDKENYTALAVEGNLYEPYFLDGDILIISKDLCQIQENNIVLCAVNDSMELRKLYISDGGTEILEGITPFIPPVINNICYRPIGFVYMRVSKYRKGAAENGTNEID